ncbi:MAG: 16S rRNA methyltransferase [Methanomassiliicoccales archaeon]|nr:16S rRNA methyltransferase [Methanomassiliicoccales archaeon]
MTQYYFILADAELELIPPELQRERSILSSARMRGKAPEKILLDASHHHPAFVKLKESERRGRPDIVHFFLMLAMDSDLNAAGKLKVFVHTRNNDVIAVKPETRLPPHYPRFVGLIESLYEQRVVPSRENALLELRNDVPLETLVAALKPDKVFVLDPTGRESSLELECADVEGRTIVVIVGGFSKGDFRTDISKFNHEKISLGTRQMKVWTVTSKVLCAISWAMKPPCPRPGPEAEVKTPKPSKSRRAPKKKAEQSDSP